MLRLFPTGASGHRPLAHRLLATGLVLGGVLLSPDHARACGALPTPSYTISGVTPSPWATGVARDVGLIVRGLPSSQPGGPIHFAEIELIDADSGMPVPLEGLSWYSLGNDEDTMALHPLEPLAPLHRYRVEVDPYDSEVGGTDGGIFISSFETSDVLLEPLTLSGELGFSLRGEEVDIVQCGPCGNSCNPIGKRSALMVDVQLPAPSGGQGVYRGVLHFTDHTPARLSARSPGDYEYDEDELHNVRLTQWVAPDANQAITLQQEVPVEESAYAPCFTYVVYDPAGHIAQTSACLPILSQADIQALASDQSPVPVAADDDVAIEQVQQEVADRRDNPPFISCALDASQTRALAWPAWSTLLLSALVITSATWRHASRRR
jgi:hypothetical protein